MSYAAILFDLDGVVIDTHASVTQFWQDLAAGQGLELTPADFQQHILVTQGVRICADQGGRTK